MNILDFQTRKQAGEKITMITCYDYSFAKIIAKTDIDCILVGDTLAMVMHGHANTLPATVDMMALHTQAVARGATGKLIIGDMPFLSYRKGLMTAMQAVEKLMQAGAKAIKLEGVLGNEELIKHIVGSGIPVIGHLGLTPQSIHQLGGFKVQGKEALAADKIINQALTLEQLGCSAVVLECMPDEVAKTITQQINIPTIGIGAGPNVDGQVLVLQDLLGMNPEFKPKLLKTYLKGFELIQQALSQYDTEVKQQVFPDEEHCY